MNQLDRVFFRDLDDDRVPMDPRDFAFGNRQTIDVDFTSGESGGNSVQKSGFVFAEHSYGYLFWHYFSTNSCVFVLSLIEKWFSIQVECRRPLHRLEP